MLACVKDQDKPVSEVCRRFEPVPQILKNVRYKGGAPLEQDQVKSAIEDGEARLGNVRTPGDPGLRARNR